MISHKRRVRARGASDFFKPAMLTRLPELVSKATDVIKNVVNIGKNTKDIIKDIKSRPPPITEVEDIVNRINRIRQGSGFAYI